MCDYDTETVDVWQARLRTSRRRRRCEACAEWIEAGHRYERLTSLYDGHWQATTRCLRCVAIYEALVARRVEPNFLLDCGTDWGDAFDEQPPPEVAALAFWLPGEPLELEGRE